jgi:hypothetical protein
VRRRNKLQERRGGIQYVIQKSLCPGPLTTVATSDLLLKVGVGPSSP